MPTFYISPNGNDSNNGTSPTTPWRTISKVNSSMSSIKAGDQILFERGGVFRGTLAISKSGTQASPISVGAYGSGKNPQFLGSQNLVWTIHQGNIWKATLSTKPLYLFQNDILMQCARYPNTGWLRNSSGSATEINDPSLTQPDGYWNGAEIIIRSSIWSYHKVTVTSYVKGKLTFPSVKHNLSNRSWGYFLTNKLSELNQAGEWVWDSSTNTIYVWCRNNTNPNTSNIEVATSPSVLRISSNIQWVNVSNIDMKNCTERALVISASNVIIDGCNITNSYKGVTIFGNNNTIRNCKFSGIYETGIHQTGGDNNNIVDNELSNCCLEPGLGANSWGYFGISITGNGTIARRNKLTNMGYIGMGLSGRTVLEENFIKDCCQLLTDGSGVAFDNCDGSIIRNNIILNSLGNTESCALNFAEGLKPKGNGIYFGNISIKNTIVEGNTVANCNGSGIWVDHTMVSSGNKIINNTLYNNTLCQIGFSDYSNYNSAGAVAPYAVPLYDDVSTGNILFSLSKDQYCMYHINRWFNGVNFGQFDNNKYWNLWNDVIIWIESHLPALNMRYHNMSSWSKLFGSDANSFQSPVDPTLSKNDVLFFYNETQSDKDIQLPTGFWKDTSMAIHTGTYKISPNKSVILVKSQQTSCEWVLGSPGDWSDYKRTRKTPYVSSIPNCTPTTPKPDDVVEEETLSTNPPTPTGSWVCTDWIDGQCIDGKIRRTRTCACLPAGSVCSTPKPSEEEFISCVQQTSGIDPNDVLVVWNSADSRSRGWALSYAAAWSIPTSNIVSLNAGTSHDASTTIANSIKTLVDSNGKQFTMLAWEYPSRVGSQSINSYVTFGPRNPSSLTNSVLYNYSGLKPRTEKGVAPSFILLSDLYIRRDAHGTKPIGQSILMLAKDTASSGNLRGSTRSNQTSPGVTVWDNRNISNISSGYNTCNFISNSCWVSTRKPGSTPVVAGYQSMFQLGDDGGVVWSRGFYGDHITSLGGFLPVVSNGLNARGQTTLNYHLDRGASLSVGSVSEPNAAFEQQFLNVSVFHPLFTGGKPVGVAAWAAVRSPDRMIFAGDGLCAPFI